MKIIRDVADMKSEIGILYMNDFNRSVLEKLFKTHDLVFHELFSTSPHIFISNTIPSMIEIRSPWKNWNHIPTFPTFKGTITPFIFRKRFSVPSYEKKNIRVTDRATLFNLLIGLDGYTVCSGVIDKRLNGESIIAVPLDEEDTIHIGYITHKKIHLSRLGTSYINALERYIASLEIGGKNKSAQGLS